jgi:D-alanine--poly(phosphoribitol) ligase subunit 2
MAVNTPSAAAVQSAVADVLAEITGVEETRSAPDLKIRDLGFLDSLGVINLIINLSERLSIDIVPAEIEETDVATPRAIVNFVCRKLAIDPP